MYLPRLATRPASISTSQQRTATGRTLFVTAAYCRAAPALLAELGANAVTGEPSYLDAPANINSYECHAVARWCHAQCSGYSKTRNERLTLWWSTLKVPSLSSFQRLFSDLALHRALTGRQLHDVIPPQFSKYSDYLEHEYPGLHEDVLTQLRRYRANKILVCQDRLRKAAQAREGDQSS